MDSFFVENITDDKYQIALIDRNRIFNADHPETITTYYECSKDSPSIHDDAQIFYTLAPSIKGLNIFSDLFNINRSPKLNTWSINSNGDNIFSIVQLNYEQRCKLYSTKHSITPDNIEEDPLDSLINFSKRQQSWKTGVLQKCIDCLLQLHVRGNPKICALLDINYNKVMRFKYETEGNINNPINDFGMFRIIRKITSYLGLKHTRDITVFKEIPDTISFDLNYIKTEVPKLSNNNDTVVETLSKLFMLWCGSKLISTDDGYRLELDNDVTTCLNSMQPLLPYPKYLEIIEAAM